VLVYVWVRERATCDMFLGFSRFVIFIQVVEKCYKPKKNLETCQQVSSLIPTDVAEAM